MRQASHNLPPPFVSRIEAIRPIPLHKRNIGPIFSLKRGETELDVWFQRQYPMGSGVWSYEATGNKLRGIPDIVVTSTAHAPFVVDAKFRWISSDSRPEETYKLLGYAENFPSCMKTMASVDC